MSTRNNPTGLLIFWFCHHEASTDLHLARVEEGSLVAKSVAQELRERHVSWLAEHGRCGTCGAAVHDLSAPCLNGCVPPIGGHVQLKISSEDWPSFNQMLVKMGEAFKKQTRQRRLAMVEDTLTDEEVAMLLEWQDGICYYCAEPFEDGKTGPIFQRDHYIALVNGGETTISNTVLACPRCNGRKRETHGDDYMRLVARERKPELRDLHARMLRRFRRKLKAYV